MQDLRDEYRSRITIPQAIRFFHSYDNEKVYQEISCYDYLLYQIRSSKETIRNSFRTAEENKRIQAEYTGKLKEIDLLKGQYDADLSAFDRDLLTKMEEATAKGCVIQNFYTEVDVKVCLNLTNMRGALRESKAYSFSKQEVLSAFDQLTTLPNGLYSEDVWRSINLVERGMVSNRIRFSIYERDRYRCVKCGRTEAAGAALEIDHIIPISKGGTSEVSNLQTLCRECNIKKGNQMEFSRRK